MISVRGNENNRWETHTHTHTHTHTQRQGEQKL